MKMLIPIFIVFIISFLLFFIWMYKNEGKSHLVPLIIAAFTLALIPTVLFAIILLPFFGFTTVLNLSLSLGISKGELMLLAISFIVYFFTLDSLIEVLMKAIVGEGLLYQFVIFLVRFFMFYVISIFLGIAQTSSLILALLTASILLIGEYLYHRRSCKKE
ncbi:MAG TPA: hypothetical protein VK061_03200 [Bacillota bacterium]|nr:hypothetical protein [Bacillota bacterium]